MARRRVVVTGLGLVTPVGNSVNESWANIVAGKSGIAPIEHFDTSGFNTRFGGSVKNFDISPYLNPKDARKMDLFIQYGMAAGAQAVQIFDTWGGTLSDVAYREFSLKYMKQIVDGLIREHEGRTVPVILFTKGGGQWLEDMAATGCDALGLDWTTDIGAARHRVGGQVALQGNMDPSVLYASPATIRQEVKRILDSYGQGSGHVFNLGHGIHQFVDPAHAGAFVEAVTELSSTYHG